jgi:cysteine desulfuration protein SufE
MARAEILGQGLTKQALPSALVVRIGPDYCSGCQNPELFLATTAAINRLKDDFDLLEGWEDRFKYVIELGRGLQPLAETDRTPANKVQGCASQVWIATKIKDYGGEPVLTFTGESDAILVQGLIAIAFMLYSGRPARDILETDAMTVFTALGLKDHLTPQRSNGLASMIARIRRDAAGVLAAAA